jgi:hypothetical protein
MEFSEGFSVWNSRQSGLYHSMTALGKALVLASKRKQIPRANPALGMTRSGVFLQLTRVTSVYWRNPTG